MQETIERLDEECKATLFSMRKVERDKASLERLLSGKAQLLVSLETSHTTAQKELAALKAKMAEQTEELKRWNAEKDRLSVELTKREEEMDQLRKSSGTDSARYPCEFTQGIDGSCSRAAGLQSRTNMCRRSGNLGSRRRARRNGSSWSMRASRRKSTTSRPA